MGNFLLRNLKLAVLGNRSERLPFVIIGVGAWLALKLISRDKERVMYSRRLRPGEVLTIRPQADRD